MQTVATLVSAVQDLMEELKISPSSALDNRILGSLAIPSSNGTPVLQSTEVRIILSRTANGEAVRLVFNVHTGATAPAVSDVSHTSNLAHLFNPFTNPATFLRTNYLKRSVGTFSQWQES